MTSKRSQLDDTKMSRGSKIHELRVSMGEPGSVDISVDMTFPHLRRRELSWIWMCFIKQIKWNYQQTNTLNSVGSKVKWGKVVWVRFRASFGNRRARSRNVGSMKWYFLKQKKSKFRNRVNLENSIEHYDGHHNFFFEKNIRFPSLDFTTKNTDWCCVVVIARLWLLDRLGHLNDWISISPWWCVLAKFSTLEIHRLYLQYVTL